jgi:4'-phosphopantetheinyl transferase
MPWPGQTSAAPIASWLAECGAQPLAGQQCLVVVADTRPWQPQLAEVYGWLDPHERARAGRFRFDVDRDDYVLAHALWRATLAICLECLPEAVVLGHEPGGRPVLPAFPGHATNLSRSGPWAAVAVATAPTVGVDIERHPPRLPLDEVMAIAATPDERRQLESFAGAARQHAMLRLWTRKEAALKAFGAGLAIDPARIETGADEVLDPAGAMPACRLADLALPAAVVGSVAAPAAVACRLLASPG